MLCWSNMPAFVLFMHVGAIYAVHAAGCKYQTQPPYAFLNTLLLPMAMNNASFHFCESVEM
jgi:hypothetical protein